MTITITNGKGGPGKTTLNIFLALWLYQRGKKVLLIDLDPNCSLSEVAESHGISRQGVHDLIKRCQKMLEGYEEKLMLVEKFCTIKEKIEQIEQLTNEVSEEPEKQLQEIKQYAAEILEEL